LVADIKTNFATILKIATAVLMGEPPHGILEEKSEGEKPMFFW
jgi:hypothetical protein